MSIQLGGGRAELNLMRGHAVVDRFEEHDARHLIHSEQHSTFAHIRENCMERILHFNVLKATIASVEKAIRTYLRSAYERRQFKGTLDEYTEALAAVCLIFARVVRTRC